MGEARYDGIAEWYDGWRPELTTDELAALMRLLGTGDGQCLDVGCGTGVATAVAAELGWLAVGVDVSTELLAVARERGLEVVEGARTRCRSRTSPSTPRSRCGRTRRR